MKKCARCEQTKDNSEFYKSPVSADGLVSYCKQCNKEYGKKWSEKRASGGTPLRLYRNESGEIVSCKCVVCKKIIPVSDMPKSKRGKFGIASICALCQAEKKRVVEEKKQSQLLATGRICGKCRVYKESDSFGRDRGKLRTYCRECERELRRVKNPHKTARQLGVKTCRKCHIEKPVSDFREHIVHGKHHGFHSWCRDCDNKSRVKNLVGYVHRTKDEIRVASLKRKADKAAAVERWKREGEELQEKRRLEAETADEQRRLARTNRKIEKERAKVDRENRPCQICGNPIGKHRRKFCEACSSHSVRYKNDSQYREKFLAAGRKWRKEHRESERNKEKMREYRERGAAGKHSQKEWRKLLDDTGHRCVKCGRAEGEIKLTRDHIVPITLGGTNDISNIQPLCESCNFSKGNRDTTNYILNRS